MADKRIVAGIRIAAGRLMSVFPGMLAMPDSDADHGPARKRGAAARRQRRLTGNPSRTDGRTKATLLLSDSVDFRLTTIAASLKSDRSTLATQLIDAGLRRFALDAALRQHVGGEAAGEAGRGRGVRRIDF